MRSPRSSSGAASRSSRSGRARRRRRSARRSSRSSRTPSPGATTTQPGAERRERRRARSPSRPTSLADLGAARRAVARAGGRGRVRAARRWTDGAPLVARRAMGRGEAWIVTLPFSVDASDLTLRPAFLALLDAWVDEARGRAAPARSDVGHDRGGSSAARRVEATGPGGAARRPTRDDGVRRADAVAPRRATASRSTARPRRASPRPTRASSTCARAPAASSAPGAAVGERRASVDVERGGRARAPGAHGARDGACACGRARRPCHVDAPMRLDVGRMRLS